MTLLLTEEEVGRLLDMDSTLDAVEFVLRDQAEGNATNRARRRVSLPTGNLSYMAAGAPELELMGIKVYSIVAVHRRPVLHHAFRLRGRRATLHNPVGQNGPAPHRRRERRRNQTPRP